MRLFKFILHKFEQNSPGHMKIQCKHFGNATLPQNSIVWQGTDCTITQKTHYCSFRMLERSGNPVLTGRISTLSTNPISLGNNKNRYMYNGKEFNDHMGLNWYDYGARFYDPQIGRFYTVDPWTEKYNDQSPYLYAYNNPIRYTDYLGLGANDEVEKEKVEDEEEKSETDDNPKESDNKNKEPEPKVVNTIDELMDEINEISSEIDKILPFCTSISNSEKYDRLVAKMNKGEKLTSEEKLFILEYMQAENKLGILTYKLSKAQDLYGAYLIDLNRWLRTEVIKGNIRSLINLVPGSSSNPEIGSPVDANERFLDAFLPYKQKPTELPYPLEY
jgi:RHS repeat-associated protein